MIASANRIRSGSADPVLNDLVDELAARLQAGHDVNVDECAAAHPEYADQLRRLIPALQVLADLSHSRDSVGAMPPKSFDPDRTGVHFEAGVSLRGTLGDFLIHREIGRGGMGVVYEADQVSLNRRVALKVLPFAATMDSKQLQRFRHEAQAAAMLNHPNIVPVFGVGNERGVHYYAMQLIGGQSLAQLIASLRGDNKKDQSSEAKRETSPVAAISTQSGRRDKAHYRHLAELMAHAADALDYAHSMGVVHRDVKPANLLLDDAGHLWVTDFGLAKLDSSAGMTMTGDLVGTLRYMSPEQALAKRGLVDERTDVYSLGATLYELLTLHPAVDGADKHEVLKKIAFTEPTPPRKVVSAIPAELETITLKCLAKEPGERYASATALAEDLRRFIADRPVVARRATRLEKTWRWARRNPGVASLMVLLLLSLCGGLATTMWQWQRADENAEKYRKAAEIAQRESNLSWRTIRETVQGLSATSSQHSASDVRRQIYVRINKLNDELGPNPSPERKFDQALIALGLGQARIDLGLPGVGSKDLQVGLELLEGLVREQPENQEYREQLVIALRVNGNAMRMSNPLQAEELARRAIIELRQLVANNSTPARRFDLATALRQWVQTLETLKRPSEDPRQESVELCRQLIAENPKGVSVDVSLELAADYRNDAMRLLNLKDFDTGLEMAQQAMKVTDDCLKRFPQRAEVISGAALSCGHVASAYYRQKEWPLALEQYQRAVALNRELVKLDSTNMTFQNNLNFELSALAVGLAQLQRYDEAHRALDEATSTQQNLLAVYKDRTAIRRTQYYLLRNRAKIYGMAENYRESARASAELANFNYGSGVDAADAALFLLQNLGAVAKDAALTAEQRTALTKDYKDRALEYLKLADARGYPDAARLNTRFFEALHDNPEFQALVTKIASRASIPEDVPHD